MKVAARLPHHPASVARARQALAGLEERVDGETVESVRLLVSELVTNSVRHGGADHLGEIELSVSAFGRTVRVEVRDSGPGFVARPRFEGQDEESGWGLHLVDALSHRWGTERESHALIWFEIDHAAEASPARLT
jgi:anti-sigma regulatory factor (Ser/Thr protein kinase)